ncbi:hypothetical protein Pmar_PMAR015532 [Perkinsus marinus ATCC 50983]|uniref:Uncharacterized protein n=1 Tax=Perkinsus marinus (strain ATCC 50983 / TXsc) TaxID=423536 RepID=C5LNB1_PERM5|nr:hypothetical protein Pmar_PMAR015532 [Perkinsus marinus ATCC 50983]EER01790.1 hypothetical protein Pmar_PMAR015532 [Perkinsus marinus ATCC 50983]|eukprot:XP_002769072.1 hypothetical protein Pmar_PMAR015532 [Perkinsus marinus ATCC 50983]
MKRLSTFLVSASLPSGLAAIFGLDIQKEHNFFFHPGRSEIVIDQPQCQHIYEPPVDKLKVSHALLTPCTASLDLCTNPIRIADTKSFFIEVSADDDDPTRKVFTVDIKSEAMPAVGQKKRRTRKQHPLNKPDPADPGLYEETKQRLTNLVDTGRLALTVEDGDYGYLATTYYGVRGAKRARPVFPLTLLNAAIKPLLVDCPSLQESLPTGVSRLFWMQAEVLLG